MGMGCWRTISRGMKECLTTTLSMEEASKHSRMGIRLWDSTAMGNRRERGNIGGRLMGRYSRECLWEA